MLRRIGLVLLAVLIVAVPGIARAADPVLTLRVDERPADRQGGIAVLRAGAVYVDAIDINKVFSGLLLFGKNSVRINIGGASANFVVGRKTATLRGVEVALPAAPFVRNRDIYVPLKMICDLAGAALSVDARNRVASVTTAGYLNRGSAGSTPTLSPLNALSLKTTGDPASDGLHLSLTVTNVSNAPYVLNFPSGARATFVLTKDGTDVWDSSSALRYTESKSVETLAPGETRTYTAVWSGYSASGSGRYLMRAKLMTTTPVSASPHSIGVVAPNASST